MLVLLLLELKSTEASSSVYVDMLTGDVQPSNLSKMIVNVTINFWNCMVFATHFGIHVVQVDKEYSRVNSSKIVNIVLIASFQAQTFENIVFSLCIQLGCWNAISQYKKQFGLLALVRIMVKVKVDLWRRHIFPIIISVSAWWVKYEIRKIEYEASSGCYLVPVIRCPNLQEPRATTKAEFALWLCIRYATVQHKRSPHSGAKYNTQVTWPIAYINLSYV